VFLAPLDDVQQVFAVLAVLYVIECVWWLRGASRRFFPGAFAAWSDRPDDGTLVDAWRLSFSNPLPFMTAYASESCPFAFDSDVLLVPTIDSASGREHYRPTLFQNIKSVSSSDRSVMIDGTIAAAFSSASYASLMASRLERIRTAPPSSRNVAAERVIAEMYDVVAAQECLKKWRSALAVTRACGGTLAVVALVGGPVLWASRAGLPPHLPAIWLAVGVSLWAATAVAALLIPDNLRAEGKSAGMNRMTAFFSPATAMRIYDTLGRDALFGFAPLIVAVVTMPRSNCCDIVTAYLRVALNPLPLSQPTEAVAVADERLVEAHRWYHERTAFYARHALCIAGLEPDAMLARVADSEEANSFCPRCGRTFVQHEGRCDICDLTLQHLP
jgi:hypothetical protein